MKKILALVLAMCMTFGLVACGNSGTDTPAPEAPAESSETGGGRERTRTC